MLPGTIDLHLHTQCSDGLDTPEQLVSFAIEHGYEAISITDHDTVAGVVRGIEEAKGTSLEMIPGIELSSMLDGEDIHILGYYIDYMDAGFRERIGFFMEKRHERAEEIVRCLNMLGLDISIDTVLAIAHGAPIGRPHIAEAMLSENLVESYNEAFIYYLGADGPAYVPKYKIVPRDAISLIRENGGVAVLAHPGILSDENIIGDLVTSGLQGLEAVHPLHTPQRQDHYRALASRYGLTVTGGSDWHGASRRRHFRNISTSDLPPGVIDELRSRAGEQYAGSERRFP